jgi:hypothetical protein
MRCPLTPNTSWAGGGTNRGGNRSSAVGLPRYRSDLQRTLYHGVSSVSWRDSQCLGLICSQIPMVTYSMLCSNVGERYTTYISTIVTELI